MNFVFLLKHLGEMRYNWAKRYETGGGTMEQKRALSAIEVAQILHVSKNTVYEMIRRGEINSYKVGRKIRFTQ